MTLTGITQPIADPESQSLASVLRTISQLAASADLLSSSSTSNGAGISSYGDRAQRLYRERRARAKIFPDADMFQEAAWDILLDLFIAHEKGVAITVSSACIAGAVPSTTSLRRLGQLERRGLVVRREDDEDRRKRYIALSEEAVAMMRSYLDLIAKN